MSKGGGSSPLMGLRSMFTDMANAAASALSTTKSIFLPDTTTKTGVVDSGATNHFGTTDGGFVSTGEVSNKIIGTANGQPIAATEKAVLPNVL